MNRYRFYPAVLLILTCVWAANLTASSEGKGASGQEIAAYASRIALEQANKDLTRRWLSELWDKGQFAVVSELLTDDFKRHSEGFPAAGPEAYAAIVKSCHDGFPDTRIELVDLIAEQDKVFVRWHWTGTHQAEFRGVPATGRKIDVYGEDLILFRDGKISDIWPLFDPLRLMLQIGAVENVSYP